MALPPETCAYCKKPITGERVTFSSMAPGGGFRRTSYHARHAKHHVRAADAPVSGPYAEMNLHDLDIPKNARPDTARAAKIIKRFLQKKKATYTGGGRTFYTPEEWKARDEPYGTDSILIVTHSGGEVGRFFSYDEEDYEAIESMRRELEKHGLFTQQMTRGHSAIYPIEK